MPRIPKSQPFEPHAPQAHGLTPLPDGPTHCRTEACGAFLEPLRRTAGYCRDCIAAQFTLAEFGKGTIEPSSPKHMEECPACLRGFVRTTPHQVHCTRDICRRARKAAGRTAAKGEAA